jgi:hypothetical protein
MRGFAGDAHEGFSNRVHLATREKDERHEKCNDAFE